MHPVNRNSARFTSEISSTGPVDFPDVDQNTVGSGVGQADPSRAAWDARGVREVQAAVKNDADQDARTSLLGIPFDTDGSPDLSHEDAVVSDVTVSSGGGTETLRDNHARYPFYRVTYEYDSSPSGGSTNTSVTFSNGAPG